MIEIENIKKSFDGKAILHGISGTFEKGKTNLIIGASGTGKSVLLKCIVGLVKPDEGTVTYDGRDFTHGDKSLRTDIRREIGMLFQGGALFDSLDPQTSITIDNLIQEITYEFDITTVVVTHDMNSVMEIGDYILFMHQGYKKWEGSTATIAQADVPELKDFIFANKLMRTMIKK